MSDIESDSGSSDPSMEHCERPKDYHGGATFESPRKVRKARSLHEEKKRNIELSQKQNTDAIQAGEE